jgi:polyphenol oxidase
MPRRATRIGAATLDWIVPAWPVASRVRSLATTRSGGTSTGPYATLNLGEACGDDPTAVAENRRRVVSFLPSSPVWLRQVHGSDVATLDATAVGAARASAPIADAAVTRERGVVLVVTIADCLPVLLADRSGRAIGIAHAGWRGLARGVLENAVAAMGVAPDDIVAWFGPAIGSRAFEVGEDVVDAFADADVSARFDVKRQGKWTADLCGIARTKLERCGLRSIHGGSFCTFEDPARFFSYRRDRETGRMAALIWLA